MIADKVKSGLYGSASEVVREALRSLFEHDVFRERRLAELRRDIALGVEQLERGDAVDGEAFFEELLREHEQEETTAR